MQSVARFVRVTPDERSSALDSAQTVLVAEADLATLVFAAQGQPPYRLLAGAPDGPTGALPLESVVPSLESERSRFGEAALGEWTEDVAVARQIAAQRRAAQLRPWLLWSVLLIGVGGLVLMVWRLARPNSGD